MKKECEKIFVTTTIPNVVQLQISKEDLEKKVRKDLAYELGKFILEHYDELPIHTMVTEEEIVLGKKYMAQINLISTEELRRLMEIENNYMKLKFME